MTVITVPVSCATVEELTALATRAATLGAGAIELRLDRALAQGADAGALIDAIPHLPLPVLATCRHASEGGAWQGAAQEREALYARADGAGARWIDCELAHDHGWRPRQAGLILSVHDFAGMHGDLATLVALAERMHTQGAAIAKIAVTARDAADLAVIRALLRAVPRPTCALAMGEHGLASRLLAQAWGSALTFACLDGRDATAAGQPTLRDLAPYRLASQGAQTQVFAVIGSPVAHSLSPVVHNAAFAHHGVDAVYVPMRVEDPVAFWQACEPWLEGVSITIPHKQALLTHLDAIEVEAQALGAINTIYRSDTGGSVGANTDAPAIQHCLEVAAGTVRGRRVLVLGAGGVARTAARACLARGAEVILANRTPERAAALAAELGCRVVPWAEAPRERYDVLLNGTSVGMGAGQAEVSPWPAAAHRPGSVVFDTVYTPLETRLLRDAQRAGATTICGLDMFIAQAVAQFERWTGLPAPEHLMYRIALERLDPGGTAQYRRRTTAFDH